MMINASNTGIADISLLHGLSLYTDPTKDNLNIMVNAAPAQTYELLLTDMLGQTIISKEISLNTDYNSISQDVSVLGSGVYFITIQSESAHATARFIKE